MNRRALPGALAMQEEMRDSQLESTGRVSRRVGGITKVLGSVSGVAAPTDMELGMRQ